MLGEDWPSQALTECLHGARPCALRLARRSFYPRMNLFSRLRATSSSAGAQSENKIQALRGACREGLWMPTPWACAFLGGWTRFIGSLKNIDPAGCTEAGLLRAFGGFRVSNLGTLACQRVSHPAAASFSPPAQRLHTVLGVPVSAVAAVALTASEHEDPGGDEHPQ
jgi:hypothetical protein